MNSFELNKIMAAVIVALLVLKVSDMISDGAIEPEMLAENAYVIEGVDAPTPTAGDKGPTGPEPITPLLASADLANGAKIFKKCAVCHSIDKGGANKVGPNLYGMVNHAKAKVSGFAYSAAMAAQTGVWNYQALNDYLYKPREAVKGTKMAFAGLKKTKDRADVIAYMRSKADTPAPLPN